MAGRNIQHEDHRLGPRALNSLGILILGKRDGMSQSKKGEEVDSGQLHFYDSKGR